MRRAARLFELVQRSCRLCMVTVRSLADIAICARHRKVRVCRGEASVLVPLPLLSRLDLFYLLLARGLRWRRVHPERVCS